jgi:outer membrane receptor protein involved in Fe transport
MEYWAPGDLADKSVADPTAPVIDEVRDQYNKQTFKVLGNHYKARLLPRLNVSFPVTENNVLYFNYSQSMKLPHPRFVYAGLDPVYQNRSFLSNLGNPNLNPEVAVTYELGIKSQINRDFGITLTAFYKDYYDYIVSRTTTVKDQTGRFVQKTFYINQDYARIRGVEAMFSYRVSRRIRAMANVAYQVATGKSNTALESKLQIVNTGQVNTTKEQYLAFDRPWDLKGTLILVPDSTDRLFNIPLKGFRVFMSSTYKSGLRYTPQRNIGKDANGRDMYESIDTSPSSEIGSSWFWTDIRITRDFRLSKRLSLSASIDITNLFNNQNAQIVNPVTGTAYQAGDPVTYTARDPNYTGPRDGGLLPTNPARYMAPRQILYGVSLNF